LSTALINGLATDYVDYSDRGLQYGDGVFETISCFDGSARWLALHLERLRAGLDRLRLPFDRFDALTNEVHSLAEGKQRCLVKVIITRGTANRRGYGPVGDERPTRIVSCHEWPATRAPSGDFRMNVAEVRLGVNPLLAGLKHLNRLEQVLAQMQCVAAGMDESLMLSATGQVIGGTMSNAFLADASGLFTPALSECGVAGIMRRVVLETADAAGIPIRVRSVSIADTAGVTEIFMTNVRLGLQSVNWFNGSPLTSEEYATRLRSLINEKNP
jgi:4-amino-4-deoxychorismate lyase